MPTMRAGSRYPITPCCDARTRTGGLSFAGHRMDLFTASYRHLAHEAARTGNATPSSKRSEDTSRFCGRSRSLVQLRSAPRHSEFAGIGALALDYRGVLQILAE